MSNEFTKQLISLLAASGGSASLPLSDLSQLGIEFTLSDLGSDSCTLRLRLGPKIYYVPEKSVEAPCPTTPPATTSAPVATPPSPSTLDAEIVAVNSLNNRASRPPRSPRYVPPEELPPSLSSAGTSSEATRQESLTSPPPSSSPLAPRVVPKTDIDLFMAEQRQQKRKDLAASRKAQEVRRQGREYPWETHRTPPPKLQ